MINDLQKTRASIVSCSHPPSLLLALSYVASQSNFEALLCYQSGWEIYYLVERNKPRRARFIQTNC
jgi:hypothetical protein